MSDILAKLAANMGQYDGGTAIIDCNGSLSRAGLAARVAHVASGLDDADERLGLLGDNSVDWVVAQLAGWVAGKTMVPLPSFFSQTQLRHLARDANLTRVVTTAEHAPRLAELGLTPIVPAHGQKPGDFAVRGGGGQIIYTSGSTGAPKGVRLSLSQIEHSANALARATQARKTDVYLSLLPLPLLLETISAICIPLLIGAKAIFEPAATRAIAEGRAASVGLVVERHRPTATVLVPQVLGQWVAQLVSAGARAPDSLRFVAVGGAPLAGAVAEKAWTLGIPVHEGYGLSECCSVVALSRPGQRVAGTVGQIIDGLDVAIDNGEICVSGPTVMTGYVNGEPVSGTWRTGDLGRWDEAGNLVIDGRKDNLIVTSNGRNISPEWIEAMIAADPRVMAVALVGDGEDSLKAVVVPSTRDLGWFGLSSQADMVAWLAGLCRDAPAYALPTACVVIEAEDAIAEGLLTPNGRVRRPVASRLAGQRPDSSKAA